MLNILWHNMGTIAALKYIWALFFISRLICAWKVARWQLHQMFNVLCKLRSIPFSIFHLEVVSIGYCTAGVDKRVRSTSLYHCRQCCVVLKPCSDCIDYTVVCFMPHDCSRKLQKHGTIVSWVWFNLMLKIIEGFRWLGTYPRKRWRFYWVNPTENTLNTQIHF